MDTVICKEVIISTIRRRGKGTRHSPIRIITEVYEKDGTLIADHDPSPETFVSLDLVHFAKYVKEQKFDPDKIDDRIVMKWLDTISPVTEK